MNGGIGMGIYVESARFVPAGVLFAKGDVTEERTVKCYELVLFLRDGGYAVINGKKHRIVRGSVRFLRPGDRVYSYRFNEIFVVHFTVEGGGQGSEPFADLPRFFRLPDTETEIGLIKNVITAHLCREEVDCLFSVCELLSVMKRRLAALPRGNTTAVQAVEKYIEEHFSERLTLESLSSVFHLHPVYLQRSFKAKTGVTPLAYQKKIRLDKAKNLLLTTDLPIDGISSLCGFCNTSYFIDVFKDSEGVTPFRFRRSSCLTDTSIP